MSAPLLLSPLPSPHQSGLSGCGSRPLYASPVTTSPGGDPAVAAAAVSGSGRLTSTRAAAILNSSLSNLGWLQGMTTGPTGGLLVPRQPPQQLRSPVPLAELPEELLPYAKFAAGTGADDEYEDDEGSNDSDEADDDCMQPAARDTARLVGPDLTDPSLMDFADSGPTAEFDARLMGPVPDPLDSWGAGCVANALDSEPEEPVVHEGHRRHRFRRHHRPSPSPSLSVIEHDAESTPTAPVAAFAEEPEPEPEPETEQLTMDPDECSTREYHASVKDTRPPYSYTALIYMAIKGTGKARVQLGEIYSGIMSGWAYYSARPNETGWKNSIRHNLTVCRCFKKVARAEGESGKGGYWEIDNKLALTEIVLTPRDSSPRVARKGKDKRKKKPTPPKSQPKGMHSHGTRGYTTGQQQQQQQQRWPYSPANGQHHQRFSPQNQPSSKRLAAGAAATAPQVKKAPEPEPPLPAHLLGMFDSDMADVTARPPVTDTGPRAPDHSVRVTLPLPERDDGFGAMAGCAFSGSFSGMLGANYGGSPSILGSSFPAGSMLGAF